MCADSNGREFLQKLLSDYFDSEISDLTLDKESKNYGASTFNVRNIKFLYRTGKITPSKTGQFVTVWKRSDRNTTCPYTLNDNLDYYVISVRNGTFMGYFIFPISIMHAKGIVADQNGEGGKTGFRIYPIWDKPNNQQAEKTQKWQTNYFLDCSNTLPDYENTKIKFNQFFNSICSNVTSSLD